MPIGRNGNEFAVNSTTAGGQYNPAVTALADGRFLVTWESGDAGDGAGTCIRARLYNADGSPSGEDFIVNSTAAGGQHTPVVAALDDGRFVVAWQTDDAVGSDKSGTGIRARIFDADGSELGNDFVVNWTTANGQYAPSITALPEGRFLVTWYSFDVSGDDISSPSIRARLYDADGVPVGEDFVVNSTTVNEQLEASVTALPDGRFVVAWESGDLAGSDTSDRAIRARLFNADGSFDGQDFVVNTTTAGNQYDVAVTALWDGRFVVTWRSEDGGDGSDACIRARVFDAEGVPATADFIVNSSAAGTQSGATVTALADGRFVVTWFSNDASGGDVSGYAIRARLFNTDGTSAGDDFVVNSTTADQQFSPTVAALADGRFVVTWYSFDTDGGDTSVSGIRAQIFDPTVFVGTAAADVWDGANLADRISGGAGADTLAGVGGNDTINGDAGGDVLSGGSGDDRLFGGLGDDMLNGNAGADAMSGGSGNDVYYIDNGGDVVNEAGGSGGDTVVSATSFNLADVSRVKGQVENLTLTGNAGIGGIGNGLDNVLRGNGAGNLLDGGAGNDMLYGGGGDDTLDAGAGIDEMQGGAGNDIYVVDDALDVVDETGGGGVDTVRASISFSLVEQPYLVGAIENLTLTGTAAIDGTGNALANILVGNSAANVLNGGAGADSLRGGTGNDTYRVDNAGDTIVESAAQGAADRVMAVVDYTLGAGVHIETLQTNGSTTTAAIDLTGNEIGQSVIGNAGSNIVDGKGGNDTLRGGSGVDYFVFSTAIGAGNVDTLADFNASADTIRLENAIFAKLAATGALDAGFLRVGPVAADANDHIVYDQKTGALYYDADGNGSDAAVQFAVLSEKPVLTAADFVVI